MKTAKFTTDYKTVLAAIETEEKNSNSKVKVAVLKTGGFTLVTGRTHEVMMAIGALADHGDDGLVGVE